MSFAGLMSSIYVLSLILAGLAFGLDISFIKIFWRKEIMGKKERQAMRLLG